MSDTETTVRALYSALERGDADAAFALFSPTMKWTEAERSPYYQGEIEGGAAIAKTVFEPIGKDFETFAITANEFVTQDDRCAAFGVYSGRTRVAGRDLLADFAHLWTVKDGTLTRFRQTTDAAAWREAFASD
jgi:ketosteroid isomerase-like protein